MHLQVVLYTFLLRLQMETNFGQGVGDPFNFLKNVRLRFIHKRPCITTFQQRLEEKIANVNDQRVYLHNERY